MGIINFISMRTTIIALLGASSAFKLHSRPVGVTFFEQGVEDTEVIGGNLNMVREGFHYGETPIQDHIEVETEFATGMNGDEDLNQNIIMKGDKYHYNQDEAMVQFATGMNGDEDLNQNIIMKGDKYHYNQANLVQTGF